MDAAVSRAAAEALLDAVDDAILVVDACYRVTYTNQATRVVLGWGDPERAAGVDPWGVVHPDDLSATLAELGRVMDGSQPLARAQFRVRHPEGRDGWKPVAALATAHFTTPGIEGVVVTFRDLEDLVADRTLVDSLTDALGSSNDFVVIHRADGGVLYANDLFRRLAGWDVLPADNAGWPYRGRAAELVQEALAELRRSGSWRGEFVMHRNGEEVRLALVVSGHPNEHSDDGRPSLIILTGRDITSPDPTAGSGRTFTEHDPVTGLPDSTSVQRRLRGLLAAPDRAVGVVLMDVDSLRESGEVLAPHRADDLVRSLVQRVRQLTRPDDIVSRITPDSFLFLLNDTALPELTSRAQGLAGLLRDSLRSPFELDGIHTYVHARFGIVVADADDTELTVLDKARLTVESTRSSRSVEPIETYSPAVSERVWRRATVERGLNDALAKGRLTLRYQPIVDLSTGRATGMEALVRWAQADGTLIHPAGFLDVAEEVMLIAEIDTFALREACRQLAAWGIDGLGVAVNMSADQLLRPDLAEVVGRALADADLDPSLLTLELTENNLYVDMSSALMALHRLRSLGVQLALDDFGTGYSSLSHLRDFDVDKVKIDRSFVASAADNRIVEAVVRMSSSFGVQVVAEGIERTSQMNRLRSLGCQLGQGYLFAEPTAPDDVFRVLQAIDDRAADLVGITVFPPA